jgi:transcriptional regulator GlxA family with amidase domain
MKRRDFMSQSAGLGVMVAAGSITPTVLSASSTIKKLTAPSKGKIPVAFTISEGATVIDFAGPWEVFQDVMIESRGSNHDDQMPFQLYTVSDTTAPVTGSGGLKLVPDYTFETAPQPKVIVVPAQRGSQAQHAWLRKMVGSTDIIMSVCTGAFQLGRAGLLSGKSATTHHDFFEQFEKAFPRR